MTTTSTLEQHQEPTTRWWHSPFRMFQTNLRETDVGFDVAAVLDAIEDHGADTWLVNAGGIVSFYPTDLDFQTRNPLLARRPGGDLLGDCLRGAQDRGIRLMARMDFSKIAPRIADLFPQWCFRNADGGRQLYQGLVSTCPSAGYYQERTLDVLDEVLGRYDVDGFFCNWFGFNEVDYAGTYHGVCHCDACVAGFAAFAGDARLPAGPDDAEYGRWRAYARETVATLTERIRDHIKSRRPEAALILGDSSDIVFHEANNAIGRPLWPYATSAAVSASRTAHENTPVLVNSVAFVDMPYRMAAEEPHHFATYFAQTIARGGTPSTYIMGVPGDIPYAGLPAARAITRFHRDHQDLYAGIRPIAPLALIRPPAAGREAADAAGATEEFHGWFDALAEVHLAADVLALEEVARLAVDGSLARFGVLVLPDVGPLPPAAAEALDAFVEAGGTLVATGSSGMSGGRVQLESMPATAELAVVGDVESLKGTYVSAGLESTADSGVYTAPTVPILGARRTMAWHADIDRWLTIIGPAPYGPPELAYGQRATDQPGLATRSYGVGSATYLPWTAGRTYDRLGTGEIRDVLLSSVPGARTGPDGDPWGCLRLWAPEQLEHTVHRAADGRIVVHLINHSGLRRRSYGPPIPITGVRITPPRGLHIAAATALVAGQDVPVTPAGELLLPAIETFDVITITTKENS
ncbi:alpha-amylase family protein [Occultella aeris]|uniref:Beta-galactosidase trimerization domain protein n=1 Tax=Occultella aeris TaxID=2761496 RepID=A0A7M4DMF9_9MICO|nr:alpha-amylase family protein [Occultella aeris]VZO38569.1 Beta-galactosidase trimerization domain protein [Occultella aeris]